MGPIEVHRRAVLPNSKWFIADELDVPIKFCPLQAAVIKNVFVSANEPSEISGRRLWRTDVHGRRNHARPVNRLPVRMT